MPSVIRSWLRLRHGCDEHIGSSARAADVMGLRHATVTRAHRTLVRCAAADDQSARSAVTGLVADARQAGTLQATNPVATRSPTTVP